MEIETQQPFVMRHPFSSRMVANSDDVDSMVALLIEVKKQSTALRDLETTLRLAIARHSKSDAKTSRVKGDEYTVKVVRPNSYWAQGDLKTIWKSWEQADKYLRIATFAPNLMEVNKLRNMSGDSEFERWKMKLLSAESPSQSPPTITVEER